MDDRLQQIFLLRPLQQEAIAYRNNMKLYKTLMKQTCMAELENMKNVEMKIPATELKMPDPKLLPPVSDPPMDMATRIDSLIEETKNTSTGIKLL